MARVVQKISDATARKLRLQHTNESAVNDMIPIGTGDIPSSGSELAERISSTISDMIKAGRVAPQVDCEMESPGHLRRVAINLTGVESGTLDSRRPEELTRLGNVSLDALEVHADPIMVRGAPVLLNISMQGMPMAWVRDDHARLWLSPVNDPGAQADVSGSVDVSAEISHIETVLRQAGEQMADQSGARLKDLTLDITSDGPGALAVVVDLAASKYMMTAKVRATANILVDQDLNLVIRKLNFTGDGMAGVTLANLITSKLPPLENKKIALADYVFAGAVLQDIHFEVDHRLRLRARCGKNTA